MLTSTVTTEVASSSPADSRGTSGKMDRGNPVLGELCDKKWPKRYAIVNLVPADSYQATLMRIGFSDVSFEGFSLRTPFVAGPSLRIPSVPVAGTRC